MQWHDARRAADAEQATVVDSVWARCTQLPIIHFIRSVM